MKTKLQQLTLVFALFVAGFAGNASADTSHGKWTTNNITIRASSVSFPAGSAQRASLGTVEARILNNPSRFWITQAYDDTSVAIGNRQNEIWFSSDASHSPAVTYTWYNSSGNIVEADIVFYSGIAYTFSMNKTGLWSYGGAGRPFETTAIHEYCHAAGLGHEDDEYSVMGQDWTHIHLNGATARSYVGEDSANGLVALYGAEASGYEDVSLTHWKWVGASGEYSTHDLCKMYNFSTGAELGWASFEGQRRYRVSKGVRYKMEFTLENNGRTTQNPNVGYYISTNSTISTSDRLIGSGTFVVSRNNVMTTSQSVTIPSDLVSGTTYYLGAIIDRTGAVAEVDESNNATYHIIRIN